MRGRKPGAISTGTSPVLGVPRAPASLSKDGKAAWRSAARIMTERGTLTEGDLPTLEAYCMAVSTARETARELNGKLTYVAPNGLMKKHPAVSIQDAAIKSLRQLACELGLTPISRSRAAMRDEAPDDGEDDPLGLD